MIDELSGEDFKAPRHLRKRNCPDAGGQALEDFYQRMPEEARRQGPALRLPVSASLLRRATPPGCAPRAQAGARRRGSSRGFWDPLSRPSDLGATASSEVDAGPAHLAERFRSWCVDRGLGSSWAPLPGLLLRNVMKITRLYSKSHGFWIRVI